MSHPDTLIYPIVGAHFRPPAPGILRALLPSTDLFLRAEPSNQFDPNAVQVLLRGKDIPETCYEELEEELQGFGYEVSELITQEEIHLGYVPKGIAALLRESQTVPMPPTEIKAKFVINHNGKPHVELNLDDNEEEQEPTSTASTFEIKSLK